jgi:hypothetical protein
MAELVALVVPIIVGIIVQFLDRPSRPVEVAGGVGHRDRIRRALDRLRDAAGRGSIG